MLWRYSSQVWLKIKMSSKYTTTNELVNGHKMSSKYTTTNELVNGHKMSSIILMKVAGAFVNPKGMTNHSKRPSLALKTVFHTS